MIKNLMSLGLVVLFVTACGSSTPPPPPPAGTPAPNAGASKWNDQEMRSETDRCVSRGSSSYSADQWRSFCGCSYQAAAQVWTYQQFVQNFQSAYAQLDSSGKIRECSQRANIPYN